MLRLALVQTLSLGTPPHAAISTALPLVEAGPRRLVHGVLSTIMRKGWSLPETPSLPAEVAARWQRAWGDEVVAKAARLMAEPPPIDLAFPPTDPAPDFDGVSLIPGHLRLAGPRDGSTGARRPAPAFGPGRWWVQDIAASMPARLLGSGNGRRALDLCAAPGGKTMQLAAAGWRVTAVDISESRLARLSDNLARTGLEAEIAAADVMQWQPSGPVDAILLDAPCSATGIFRRHPDVLHRVRPRAILELAEVQKAMLLRAADWLRPGGRLVYSVCSLEREEGESVAAVFLARRPDLARVEEQRILPGAFEEAGGADSFYIALFERLQEGNAAISRG